MKREHTWREKIWAKMILHKYNYTCQRCGATNKMLTAHHIEPFSSNKDLRHDTRNGICLCNTCHVKYHKKYKNKINLITLTNFLNKGL